MKLIDLMRHTRIDEAPPLKRFDVLPDASKLPGPSKKLQHSNIKNIPKDLQTVVSQPFQKALKKKMQDIPYPIYIYQMAIAIAADSYDRHLLKLQHQSVNPEFYHMIDKKALIELYGRDIANKIKLDPAGVTLVYNYQTAFPSTVWGFMHDFVHAITLSNIKTTEELEKVDTIIENIVIHAQKSFPDSPILRKEIGRHGIERVAYSMLTMKSARTGFLSNRPEEGSTELMTQWLFSKKIEFDWSKISNSEKMDEVFSELVNKAIPKIDAIFWRILMSAKGKSYFTS